MRTLNRPMFRMGGSIKEGVMHGIREPRQGYKLGSEVVKQVGTKIPAISNIYNRGITNLSKLGQKFKGLFGTSAPHQPITQVTKQPITKWSKGYHGTVPGGSSFQPSGPIQNVWTPKGWVARDPTYQIGKKIVEGSGWIGKPLKWAGKTIATPTGGLGLIYVGGKWLKSDGTPATEAEVIEQFKSKKGSGVPGGGDKGMRGDGSYDSAKATELAKAAKEKRINSLLETMGYDKAQKNAAYDALIDASKIITDRGSLKGDVTGEIINPIIQATSKRFDKPQQIREAVGLMQAKGDIEKDIATSKGSPTLQTAKDMVNTGAAKNIQDAMKKLTKQSTMADTLGAIKGKGISIGADEVEIAYRIENPDVIPNLKIKGSDKEYKKWKNDNEGKTEMDFMEEIVSKSDKFSPGVYIIDKRAIVVDNEGNMAYEW